MKDMTPVPQPRLSTVHDALNESVFSEAGHGEPTSVRIDETLKERAQFICQRHGTSLSKFMRECVAHLVRDYTTPETRE